MTESEACPDYVDVPTEGALISDRPGGAWLARGPMTRSRVPAEDAPALFAPDFFLDDEAPWRTASEWVHLDLDRIAPAAPSPLVVDPPDREPWDVAFRDTLQAIACGEIAKLVPVVFAQGSLDPETDVPGLVRLVVRHAAASPVLIPYGIWRPDAGVVGATPEILFRLESDGTIETMALAGTAAPDEIDSLVEDAKQRHEHAVVIEFIRDALRTLEADVEVGDTEVVRLPHLAHLRTRLSARPRRHPSFEQIVRVLHPTAALGGQPAAAAIGRLRELDRGVGRDRFGAPFGIRFPDGRAFCVVAIRNIAWRNGRVRIGAGAGLVAGSRCEEEWLELARKIESVASVFSS